MSSDALTHALDAVDLPGLIAERYPDSGCKPSKPGTVKAVWRGENNPSVSVYKDNDRWLWKDHATNEGGNAHTFFTRVEGMSKVEATEELKRRAGIPESNQITVTNSNKDWKNQPWWELEKAGHLVATYDYHDTEGRLILQAGRFEHAGDKTFRQRRRDGEEWRYTLNDITLVLYRLSVIAEAVKRGDIIFVAEGEKDVHALEAAGLTATCNPMGAGKWRDEYNEHLRGAHVVILPDNDDPGRKHAETVAQSLHGTAASVRVLELPDLQAKGDVSDWLAAGHTADELLELSQAAPIWEPTATAEADTWEARLDLPELSPDPPDMPPDLIPDPLRAWIKDAADRACVHLAFIAVIALASLGAVLGRTLAVHPKQRDDWLEVANLWAAIVAPPSSLKTAAGSEGTVHVRRLEAEAMSAYQDAQATRAADAEILKMELDQLRKAAKATNARPRDFAADIEAKLTELRELEDTNPHRYVINDATIEKASEIMAKNPPGRGLLYSRDELVGLLKTCDKPGHETDRAFLLEAWNGKNGFTADRIGRGTVRVPAVTLSILGGIQPGRLRSYIRGAMEESAEADGLLQRFQLITWFDKARPWKRVDKTPDKEAKKKARGIFTWIDQLEPTQMGLTPPDAGEIPAIRFDSEAQDLYNAWLDDLMERLRSGAYRHAPAFHAHLAKYPSLMPSLALLFHLITLADQNATRLKPISFDAATLAIAWCEYLELHAKKVYAAELSTAVLSAHTLAEKIEQQELVDGDKLRDIYAHRWPGLSTAEEVNAALEILEAAHWVRIEELSTGGRPSRILRLHPELRP